MALARSLLQSRSEDFAKGPFLPDSFRDGLVGARWPGRCQTVLDPKRTDLTWYLDGAHTVESLVCCMQWFVSPGVGISPSNATSTKWVTSKIHRSKIHHQLISLSRVLSRFLIFNCTSGRSGETFLRQVLETTRTQLIKHGRDTDSHFFDHVIFCTNVTYADGHFKGGEWQPTLLNSPKHMPCQTLQLEQSTPSIW